MIASVFKVNINKIFKIIKIIDVLFVGRMIKWIFALLFVGGIVSSCESVRQLGQDDIDRINHNEKLFSKEMKGYWER